MLPSLRFYFLVTSRKIDARRYSFGKWMTPRGVNLVDRLGQLQIIRIVDPPLIVDGLELRG
jgi:hypothetical protein